MTDDKKIKRILVIRFSSLGDVVLTTPLFPNLKARWPDASISVLTKPAFAALFDKNPHVTNVRIFSPSKQTFSDLTKELRNEHYDILIDLQNNIRSWFIRLIAGVEWTVSVKKFNRARRKLVWFKRTSPDLEKSVRERNIDCLTSLDVPVMTTDTQLFPDPPEAILRTFSIDPGKKLIGLAPGAKHNTKQWPADKFAEAANRLGAIPNTQILLFGDKNNKSATVNVAKHLRVPYVDLAGWTSIRELITLVSKLSLLITNDSGILHIGEAFCIPLVALFGPTVRSFGFAPYRDTSRVVEVANLPCRPCTLHGDKACPLRHHRCMVDLDVNAVLMMCSALMEKSAVPTEKPV